MPSVTDARVTAPATQLSENDTCHSDEVQELTDKLTHYIKRVRDVRAGRSHVDSAMFFKSLDSVEKEMRGLRSLYERELTAVRQELSKSLAQVRSQGMTLGENNDHMSNLQQRIQALLNRNQTLEEALQAMEGQLHHSAHESHGQELCAPVGDHKYQELQQQYEAAVAQRKAAENMCNRAQSDLSFAQEAHRQETHELQCRLDNASATIAALELRSQDSTQVDTQITSLIEEIKDAAKRDMAAYKATADESYARTISMLRGQMEEDKKSFAVVMEENARLIDHVGELKLKTKEMELESSIHMKMKVSLEEMLAEERRKSAQQLKSLEDRLAAWKDSVLEQLSGSEAAQTFNSYADALGDLIPGEEMTGAGPTETPPPAAPPSPLPTAAWSPVPNVLNTTIVESVTGPQGVVTNTSQILPPAHTNSRPGTATPRPVGPIRPSSAAVRDGGEISAGDGSVMEETGEPQELGQGRDYFKEMFEEKERSRNPSGQSNVIQTHEYNLSTNSATGPIRIAEVHPEGSYIRLTNSSSSRDMEMGGYTLQQNVGGNPVALYRFPVRLTVPPGGRVTVYSGGAVDPIMHQPPVDFVWSEQERWGTGPECTTIVCKPNGQAVAWSTSAHRFGGLASPAPPIGMESVADISSSQLKKGEKPKILPLFEKNPSEAKADASLLKREKTIPPSLTPPRHPHGTPSSSPVRPSSTVGRQFTSGNDNSSNNRQTRSQSARPDPMLDEPYAGIRGQRMGTAPHRGFTPMTGGKRKPALATHSRQSGGVARRYLSELPSPFQSPLQLEFARRYDNRLTSLIK